MKKVMMVLGVALCATLLVTPAMAGDCEASKKASNEGASCSTSAAKAAYTKTLDETGCEKTAQKAYNNTLAENVYAKSYANTSCSKTAEKAAYDAVYDKAGCEKTATASATHAVAQASYNDTLAKTGCEKSAQAAYASITKTVGSSCAAEAASTASGCDKPCDKGAAEGTSGKVADAGTKLASNEGGSSR
jgi:hypothetical protein